MKNITAAQVRAAAKSRVNESNLSSVLVSLDRYGAQFGMDLPHRLAQYFPQLMHESGDFRYDGEIWGPTPAQERYDTRTDLGNTPEKDGDGYRYRGRTAMQLTGKDNYRQFSGWCRKNGINCPDFVADPDKVNTDPWEGLVPLWYWDSRKINTWADQGDIETITKKINGGKNGLADRIDRYGRVALVLLGYGVTEADIKRFQAVSGLGADGDVGPKTRAKLHAALLALSGSSTKLAEFAVAPVTAETETVPVAVETQVKKKFSLFGWVGGFFSTGGLGLAAFAGVDWKAIVAIGVVAIVALLLGLLLRGWIIAAIGDIRRAVEAT